MEKSTKELKNEYQDFLEDRLKNLEKLRVLLKFDEIIFNQDEVNNSVKLYFQNYANPQAIGFSDKEFENIIDTY